MSNHTELTRRLRQSIGLDVTTLGPTVLTRALKTRQRQLGLDSAEEYENLLARSPAEWSQFVEAMVVPETWFLRDPEVYAALTRYVLEEWAPANPGGTLRVLSAPCSTGEEPLTMAIALLEAGWPAARLQVTGLDLSTVSLARAERGVYGENSFRGPSREWRDRYFTQGPDGYTVRSDLRRRIEYRNGNLIAPEQAPATRCYDVVFCRNVLIYFDAEMQARALAAIERRVAPGGWFMVGAAEAFLTRFAGYEPRPGVPSAFYPRGMRPEAKPTLSVSVPWPAKVVRWPMPRVEIPKVSSRTSNGPAGQTTGVPMAAMVENDLRAIAKMMEGGDLAGALAAGEALVRRPDGATADAFCLLGLVREAKGELTLAAEAYRRALYLEPGHLEALGHLALLRQAQGDGAGARRLSLRAMRSAGGSPS